MKFYVGGLEVFFVKGEKIEIFRTNGEGMLHNTKLNWISPMKIGSMFSYDGKGNMVVKGKQVLKDGEIVKENVNIIDSGPEAKLHFLFDSDSE